MAEIFIWPMAMILGQVQTLIVLGRSDLAQLRAEARQQSSRARARAGCGVSGRARGLRQSSLR